MPKKKTSHKKVHKSVAKPQESYLVIVRSWMLLVMFGLMLGLGALLGTYINANMNGGTVAGAQVELR